MSNVEPESAQTPGDRGRALLIPRNKLAFNEDTPKEEAVLRNQTDRPLRLRLEVLDPIGAFTLPPEIQEITLQSGDSVSVPVQFAPRKEVAVMATSAIHKGKVHVWDLDAVRIVGAIDLSGVGIGCAPLEHVSCMVQPSQDVSTRGNRPSVTVSVKPEVAWPGDVVRATYSVTGADEVHLSWGHPGAEIIEEAGAATDFYWLGHTWNDPASGTIDFVLNQTTSLGVHAINADGFTTGYATVSMLYGLGYYNARTPLGGVYRWILNSLATYLSDIENRLNSGCIRNNSVLDKFNESWYMRAPMTDDMLTFMKDLLIYSSIDQYPSALRAQGSLGSSGVQGEFFPGLPGVGISVRTGADALTLLHELCHLTLYHKGHAYNWVPFEECRVATAAQMCFGMEPPLYSTVKEPNGEIKRYKCQGWCRELV